MQLIGTRRAWIAIGILLALPALAGPFMFDDYILLASLEDVLPVHGHWWNLYTFVPAGAATREPLMQSGLLPWWSAPDLKVALFRPLSSALLTFDHALFGRNPLGAHVHSLVWWAAVLGAVALLFRRVVPASVATLAMALFAIDDAHFMPIVWWAARNGLVATAPALLGLYTHLRWRQDHLRAGALMAPLGFAVGLTGGESALCVFAYVIAYELIDGAGTTWRQRSKALAPYIPLLVIYGFVRAAAGAGVTDSGAYFDPTSDPLGFAWAAAGRIPALAGNLVWNIPAELWSIGPRMPARLVTLGIVAVVFVSVWLRSALGRLEPNEARAIRWLAAGALLSLIPCAGAIPGERCALPASVGAAAVFAVLVRDGLTRWREAHGIRGRVVAGATLAAIALPNVVLAAPLLVGKIVLLRGLSEQLREVVCAADLDRSRPIRVLVAWSDDPLVSYGWGARWCYCPGKTVPWTFISQSPHAQKLTRVSANALMLEFPDKPAIDAMWEILFRDPTIPMPAGTIIRLEDGLVVTVQQVAQGRPTRVLFEFAQPIEESAYRLVVLQKRRLGGLALKVGESVTFGGSIFE
jgi:hypothetical protein